MGADAISHRQMLIDLQEAFGFFDNNGEGCISAEEIAMVIRSLDRSPATADDVRPMTRDLFDEDGNGAVEFQQLLKLLARKKQETDTEEELKEAFKVFDKDQNGFISPSELKQVMINLGERLSDEEVEQMIKEADLDGDGLVNYEEFVNIMTGTPV